jgi:hypothetical protein
LLNILLKYVGFYRSYQNLHNRSTLFAGAEDGRTPSPFNENNNSNSGQVKVNMNDRDLDYLESQNDDEISGLSAKVKILKNVRQ